MTQANNQPPYWSMINRYLWRQEILVAAIGRFQRGLGLDIVPALSILATTEPANDPTYSI